jgi:hypothetical protein
MSRNFNFHFQQTNLTPILHKGLYAFLRAGRFAFFPYACAVPIILQPRMYAGKCKFDAPESLCFPRILVTAL